jgi:hypothetical protein
MDIFQKRRYYSSRINRKTIDLDQLYVQVQSLYSYFKDKDFFKEKLDISGKSIPESARHKSILELKFNIFPIHKWESYDVTEDNVFDAIEFLFHHISKPGDYVGMTSETGFNYYDYVGYDELNGKNEYQEHTNMFLADYKDGYELSEEGEILSLGKHGLEEILDAEIISYDYENVDSKVKAAINKWKNRHLSIDERKQAVIDLSDVFEWLKKSEKLSLAMDKKDESALFEIANNFSLRHHNPNQKSNYDKNIWYSWIFHFYLATYHAVIRQLKKHEEKIK